MPDLGEKLTEQRLEDIRKELERVYTEAAKDLHEKARAYLRQFERKDKEKQAAVAAGKITEQDRKNWLKGQVFTGKQWPIDVVFGQITYTLTSSVFGHGHNWSR